MRARLSERVSGHDASEVRDLGRRYQQLTRLDGAAAYVPHAEHQQLKVVILGGCFTQLTDAALEEESAAFGYEVELDIGWPTDVHLIDGLQPDLVVLQPATTWLLSPVWDEAPFVAEEELISSPPRQHEASSHACVSDRGRGCVGRLLLVQGFSSPQYSPFGRNDFRQRFGFSRIVGE